MNARDRNDDDGECDCCECIGCQYAAPIDEYRPLVNIHPDVEGPPRRARRRARVRITRRRVRVVPSAVVNAMIAFMAFILIGLLTRVVTGSAPATTS
ncbi:hypothetical protein TWF481_009136 [Arthrobotrys musiformis]|uniref:Uncharacterized protein n=1 Tax=Arthrobotrys musiformis TaxID=47236 RepID=A0AAV9W4V5_9PEZI